MLGCGAGPGGGRLLTVIPSALSRANHVVMKTQTVLADGGASFAGISGGRGKPTTMPNSCCCPDVLLSLLKSLC